MFAGTDVLPLLVGNPVCQSQHAQLRTWTGQEAPARGLGHREIGSTVHHYGLCGRSDHLVYSFCSSLAIVFS